MEFPIGRLLLDISSMYCPKMTLVGGVTKKLSNCSGEKIHVPIHYRSEAAITKLEREAKINQKNGLAELARGSAPPIRVFLNQHV